MAAATQLPESTALARVGLGLSSWFEKWFPDAFVLALSVVAIVFVASLGSGSSVLDTAQWFGTGFWGLVTFTMQMSMIVVTGYAVATAPPVYRVVRLLATVPKTGRGAAAYVGLFSMLASLVSWSFSLIFSALLAREVAQRVRGSDYRAIGAAAYLGVGSVWALGMSSSAALIMANSASLPDSIESVTGTIPLGQTIGLWQSLAIAASLIVVSMAVAYYSAPSDAHAKSMSDMGVTYAPATSELGRRMTPGEWLEYSPLLTIVDLRARLRLSRARGHGERARRPARPQSLPVSVLDDGAAAALAAEVVRAGDRGLRDARRRRAHSVSDVRGCARDADEVGARGGHLAVLRYISNEHTFPVLVGIYSAFLGLFIPSAGGKWLLEAQYLLEAGIEHRVHLGWVVQTYNATEALANLIHPFWMLPLVGILGLKARDIVGFSMLQFIVHVPLVLLLVWLLNYTLTYVAPILP